jgi:hypothetical protein
MQLRNSWQAYLRAINKANSANKNFGAFINAMAEKNSKNDKITALMEDPDSIIMVADNRNRVKFTYSCKKFGGTRTKPTTMIGGLIGQGARAFPIVIDKDNATSSKLVKIPTTTKIWAFKDTEQLKNLLSDTGGTPPIITSPVGPQTRMRSAALAASTSETEALAPEGGRETQTQEYMESSIQIPLPILAIAALESPSIDPLNLIIAVKNAANNFNDTHKDNDVFKFDNATIGAKKLAKWLYAIHLGLISKTRLSIEPDNEDLTKHAKECHRACILPPVNQRSLLVLSTEDNESVIRQLIASTNRNNEACKEKNRICKQEYERLKDNDDLKKDRTKDLHPSIKIMIENASTSTRNKSGELCSDFISLYNSKNPWWT